MRPSVAVRSVLVSFFVGAWASPLVAQTADMVHGDDGRIEPYDQAATEGQRASARATAAFVANSALTPSGGGFALPRQTYGETNGLCAGERFATQPAPAFCTGFLVEPQLVATAAECVSSDVTCAQTAIVFDFAMTADGSDPTRVDAASVFHCASIVGRVAGAAGDTSYALIQLDRPVPDRTPLSLRRHGELAVGTPLYAVGNPGGLPLKVSGGAAVVASPADKTIFTASLDSGVGGMGSPVVAADGVVEGILARSERDLDIRGGCSVERRCAEGACPAQEVTRASVIAQLVEDPSRPTVIQDHEYPGLALAIPDASDTGVTLDMPIDQGAFVAQASVHVTLTHTYIGDLLISLIHPDGTVYVLHDHAGGSTDNLDQTFDLGTNFREKPSAGTWLLKVQDTAGQDVGTLTYAKLTLKTFLN